MPTISMIVTLLISFLFRIAPIFVNQIYFWFDQGLDMVLVKQLVIDHDLSLTGRYSGLAGVLMGPLWTWVLSVPFILGAGNPAANVIFFSVVCTLSIYATYLFLKKNINPASAVFVLLFLCFAPIYTFGSQVIASPHPLIFLFIFFIWFCYEIFALKRNLFLVPLGFLIGIFFQLEIGFAVFTLPTVVLLTIAFKKFAIAKDKFFYLGIALLGLTFVPQFLFDLRHDFLITNSLLNLFTGKSNTLYGAAAPIGDRLISRFFSFWEDFQSFALFIKPWYLAAIMLILSLIGWLLIFKNRLTKEQNLAKILLITLLGFYLGFSFYPGPLWTWYRSGLPIVYILLLIVPFGVLWQKIRPLGFIAILLIVFSINQAITSSGLDRIVKNQPYEDNAILQNQLAAIDYVYEKAAGRPFTYYAYTPPVYDYLWQYHFFWYGQKKYGYLPTNFQMGVPILGTGKDKTPPKATEGLFFLIMEPDRERPWQINGWKKTFIKVGKTQSTIRFPGDIVVEQRQTD